MTRLYFTMLTLFIAPRIEVVIAPKPKPGVLKTYYGSSLYDCDFFFITTTPPHDCGFTSKQDLLFSFSDTQDVIYSGCVHIFKPTYTCEPMCLFSQANIAYVYVLNSYFESMNFLCCFFFQNSCA